MENKKTTEQMVQSFDEIEVVKERDFKILKKYLNILIDPNEFISSKENMKFFEDNKNFDILGTIEKFFKFAGDLLVPFVDHRNDTKHILTAFEKECGLLLIEIARTLQERPPISEKTAFDEQFKNSDLIHKKLEEQNEKIKLFKKNQEIRLNNLEKEIEGKESLNVLVYEIQKVEISLVKTKNVLDRQKHEENTKKSFYWRAGVFFLKHVMPAAIFVTLGNAVQKNETKSWSFEGNAITDIFYNPSDSSNKLINENVPNTLVGDGNSTNNETVEEVGNKDKRVVPPHEKQKEDVSKIEKLSLGQKKALVSFIHTNFPHGEPIRFDKNYLKFETKNINDIEKFKKDFDFNANESDEFITLPEKNVLNFFENNRDLIVLPPKLLEVFEEKEIKFIKITNNVDVIIRLAKNQDINFLNKVFGYAGDNEIWTGLNSGRLPVANQNYTIPHEVLLNFYDSN